MSAPFDYAAVARELFTRLDTIWVSQEAMDAAWLLTPLGAAAPMDRTKHADYLIRRIFQDAWETVYVTAHPDVDRHQVPRAVHADLLAVSAEFAQVCTDYNLATQVLPNLAPHAILLDKDTVSKELAAVEAEFDKLTDIPHPTKTKKAKVDPSWDVALQERFTRGIALARINKTFQDFTTPSWRITPHGRTSALTDSGGVSGLSALADPYVRVLPHLNAGEPLATAYVTWPSGSTTPYMETDETVPGTFRVPDLPPGRQTFTSDSGGGMLGQVMLSRALAYIAWKAWAEVCVAARNVNLPLPGFYVVAKLSSLRLVGPKATLETIQASFKPAEKVVPDLTWNWDTRAPMLPSEQA